MKARLRKEYTGLGGAENTVSGAFGAVGGGVGWAVVPWAGAVELPSWHHKAAPHGSPSCR